MTELQKMIVAEALSWADTPYHHQACVKGAGVDCAMFLVGVYCGLGLIEKIDPRPYQVHWHLHRGEERFLKHLARVSERVYSPQPGDVAMFRFGRCTSHGAIVLDWPRIIHSYIGQGVVEADATKGDLVGRFVGWYRILKGK